MQRYDAWLDYVADQVAQGHSIVDFKDWRGRADYPARVPGAAANVRLAEPLAEDPES